MHVSKLALNLLVATLVAAPAVAAPLAQSDIQALNQLQRTYVEGWLRNDREAVMGVMADDSVFIPHDGVMPRIGAPAISEFWFPGGRAVGRVPAFELQATNISGDDHQATVYGRSDLHYETADTHYHWVGSFLIVARKDGGRWLVSHMMASDAAPTVEPIRPPTR